MAVHPPRSLLRRTAPAVGVGLALVAAQAVAGPSAFAHSPSAAGVSAAAPSPGSAYVVVAGDTVSAIALRSGVSVGAIVAANGLNSRALIRIGQRLTIPGSGDGASAPLVGDTFLGRTYPPATVASANENKAALLAQDVPSRAAMQDLIRRVALILGVDPALAQAVAYQESGFNQQAVSPANAIGAMQVIPTSGEWASTMVGRPLDLRDPLDNATAGVAILRRLLESTDGDVSLTLAAYYQGLAGVRRDGMYPDTRSYVTNVQSLMTRFR